MSALRRRYRCYGRLVDAGADPRGAERRPARGGRRHPRPGRDPRRCRNRQDDHDHAPDRPTRSRAGRSRPGGPRGHVHREGRGRAQGAARQPRRRGVEARTFHAAALSQLSSLWQRSRGEPLPEILDAQGAADRLARERAAAAAQVHAARRARGRDRVGEEPPDLARPDTSRSSSARATSRRSRPS